MPVHLSIPDAASLAAVRGVRIGVAEAGIRKAARKDLTVFLLDEGCAVGMGVIAVLVIVSAETSQGNEPQQHEQRERVHVERVEREDSIRHRRSPQESIGGQEQAGEKETRGGQHGKKRREGFIGRDAAAGPGHLERVEGRADAADERRAAGA